MHLFDDDLDAGVEWQKVGVSRVSRIFYSEGRGGV